MNLKLSALAVMAATAITLSGCASDDEYFYEEETAAAEAAEVAEAVKAAEEAMKADGEEDTLNRVMVRDDSALLQDSSVGGAAIRQEENSTQVLYNDHHVGDSKYSLADLGYAPKDAKANAKNSANAKNGGNGKCGQTAKGKKNGRDRSIYSKDKSIYSTSNCDVAPKAKDAKK